jgi:hypothetical protein
VNDTTNKKNETNTRIHKVTFFVEPPIWLSKTKLCFDTFGLPKDFVQRADAELELDGDLITFIESMGDPFEIEKIARLEDDQMEAFFSKQAEMPMWAAHYATGASGARYSVLVEYGLDSKEMHEESSRIKNLFNNGSSSV